MARSIISKVNLRKTGSFTVEGYDDLIKRLNAVIDETSAKELKTSMMKGAVIVRDEAKRNAPVLTGKLEQAIFAAPGKTTEPSVLVGISRSRKKNGANAAPHGVLIEYGTGRYREGGQKSQRPSIRPRRFFRNAIKAKRAAVSQLVLNGIRNAITKAFKK